TSPMYAVHNGVVYDTKGLAPQPQPPNTWSTLGRKQPYMSAAGAWLAQNPITQPPTNPSILWKHTFFQHNGRESTLKTVNNANPKTWDLPFYWPVHLDRRLVNPLELLNVSCYRPWEYTQKFGTAFDHRAPWDNETTLLFRLLEMTQTPYYVAPSQGP